MSSFSTCLAGALIDYISLKELPVKTIYSLTQMSLNHAALGNEIYQVHCASICTSFIHLEFGATSSSQNVTGPAVKTCQ